MPCCRIDSISSNSASRAKSFRGCNVLGTMLVSSIWWTFSPASDPSLGMATEGVPISALRPLPKPERAIASEATGTEFSTQTANRQAVPEPLQTLGHCRSSPIIASGHHRFAPEKQLKKVLTLKAEIQYQRGMAPKQRKDFYPVGSLSVRSPV